MDVIEEQILAYNSRDLERFLAAYSPDVVIEECAGSLLAKGQDKMRERYGTLFSDSPGLHGRIINRMRIGNCTVDDEELTGIGGSPSPKHALVIYRVEADKIIHVRMLG